MSASTRIKLAASLALGIAIAPAARAQCAYATPCIIHQAIIDTSDIHRSGPRYGVIFLSPGITDSIRVHNKGQSVSATTSLFGWEFERQLFENPKGVVPITNLVLGVAGLDQGLILPSATWLVGMRTADNFEFGIGPNVSPLGAALALGAGVTLHSGKLNIPFDVAYVSSKVGPRYSLTTGFNVVQ
jgi:hypothetical protein